MSISTEPRSLKDSDADRLTLSASPLPDSAAPSVLAGLYGNRFLAAVAAFLAINLILSVTCCPLRLSVKDEFAGEELSENLPPGLKKPWPWWLARGYLTCRPSPGIVVFGSSQMGSAQATADAKYLSRWIDVIKHRRIFYLENEISKLTRASACVLSLAMPGAVISDEYLMSKSLLPQEARSCPELVVITVAPRDFIDDTLPSPSATDQFKFFSRFVQLGDLEEFAYHDPFDRLDSKLKQLPLRWLSNHWNAAFREDAATTTREAGDLLQAITSVASNPSPGQWVVPPVMPNSWTDNTREYVQRFKGPNMRNYRSQMEFFKKWLHDLSSKDIKILVVGMPSMEMNRALLPASFWSRFKSDVSCACAQNQAQWLDLTDSGAFVRRDYLDTVHLNASGAEKLFAAIARAVYKQTAKL